MKFATFPVGRQIAPSIVLVTPAITTFSAFAEPDRRKADHVEQYSFVFERLPSAIVQFRITEFPCM